MQFYYYVLNYNFNKEKVEMFNIFNNIVVQEYTEKAIKKYLRSPSKYKYIKQYAVNIPECNIIKEEIVLYGFEALCEEIKSIIKWQEWSRFQYEVSVGCGFESDCTRLEKWDCYKQCEPNIEMIVRDCLYQYKQAKNEKMTK